MMTRSPSGGCLEISSLWSVEEEQISTVGPLLSRIMISLSPAGLDLWVLSKLEILQVDCSDEDLSARGRIHLLEGI